MFKEKIDPKQKFYVLWIKDSEYFEVHPAIVAIAKLLFADGFEFYP